MFWLVLLVTGHAMGWPAFAAAHDGGLYAGMVAAWVVGVLAALFWTFMLIMSEEGMLSGGAAAVATCVCCFLVIIPLFVVLNLGLGAARRAISSSASLPRPRRRPRLHALLRRARE